MLPVLCLAGLLLAACDGGGGDASPVSPTPVPTVPPTTSTTVVSETTTSSGATTTTTTLAPLESLRYRTVADQLPFPTHLAVDAAGRTYLTTKDGQLWMWPGLPEGQPSPVLDLRGEVSDGAEQGLLAVAPHPDPSAPLLYLHYTDRAGDTALVEYRVGADGVLDRGSARRLLRVEQPASNHNGGMLAFGPDGFLYLALGDGGGANDRFGNGQRPDTLLGTLLRLDPTGGDPYAIPADNPWAGGGEGAPEVWAFGLRNPWRFWFDGGLLYVADVGQGSFEEVNVAPADAPGLNYGWPVMEGLHCFRPASGCDTSGLTLPVLEVAHGDGGTCSITGGVVYRGAAIPELADHYLYSDYCGGWLRSFRLEDGVPAEATDWTDQVGVPGQVTSFGVDSEGEVYVLTTSEVLKLEAVR